MQIETGFASQLYASARRMASPEAPNEAAGTDARETAFADALAAVAGDMAETLRASEATAQKGLAGQADVQSVVEALTSAELALQTAVTVRDRVVEAYQEVLRMPI